MGTSHIQRYVKYTWKGFVRCSLFSYLCVSVCIPHAGRGTEIYMRTGHCSFLPRSFHVDRADTVSFRFVFKNGLRSSDRLCFSVVVSVGWRVLFSRFFLFTSIVANERVYFRSLTVYIYIYIQI